MMTFCAVGHHFFKAHIEHTVSSRVKQEGQEALNRLPEFCFKLTYRYLLRADHVPGDIWGRAIFGPRSVI